MNFKKKKIFKNPAPPGFNPVHASEECKSVKARMQKIS